MTPEKDKQPQSENGPNLNDRLTDDLSRNFESWRIKFDRFGWDVLGIIFLAFSLILLLGLFGLSKGGIIILLVSWIRRWAGWGGYLFSGLLAYAGIAMLRRRSGAAENFSLGKVIAIEFAGFLAMGVFSVLGGHSLVRAENGLDGGQIGWGLVELFSRVLPVQWTGILMGAAAFLLLAYGLGIYEFLARRLESWAEKVSTEPDLTISEFYNGINDIPPAVPLKSEQKSMEDETTAPLVPAIFGSGLRSQLLPPLDLLNNDEHSQFSEENVHETARKIENTLLEFSIPARVVGYRVGPTVTQFAVEPGYVERPSPEGEVVRHKVRVSQISALSKDLALALSAERLRIEAPVPGQSFVGIEVPNPKSNSVGLRSILESEEFQALTTSLAIALGKDVSGRAVAADLTRMPHLLIAGTTGSGKSVCIAALTMCLVMNNTPEQLKLVMIDPKMVELVRFNGLKHLLGKVETNMERIPIVLRWALSEMDRRYRLLESARARNIDTYNSKPGRKKEDLLPWIVIMIDELADLMFSAPDQTEHSLVRLAQMARATGIHMVVATQRPSTDVVTGLIKANFPARISFNVASSIDSRVILDSTGAETLLGKGDMLFLHPEHSKPIRTQGVIISDDEIEKLIDFWQDYETDIAPLPPWEQLVQEDQEVEPDQLVARAVEIVQSTGHASASMLQRRLRIGYPRAARLIDELEELGVVGPSQGGGREREVLIDLESDFGKETRSGDPGAAQEDGD